MHSSIPVAPQFPSASQVVKRLLRLWRRRLGLFLLVFGVVLVCGGVVIWSLTPKYSATSTVVLTTQNTDPLAPMGQQQSQAVEDDRPSTEAAMLQSRDVAAAVLKQYPPLPAPPASGLAPRLCKLGVGFLCHKTVPMTEQEREQAEIGGFLKNLTVMPELHSRILDVTVSSTNGQRAAELADAVVTNYQELALAKQTADLNRVASWLDARTEQLRQRWLDAVGKANAFDVSNGLSNQANGDSSDPLIDKQISETTLSLSQAQARLAQAQARADALRQASKSGDTAALIDAAQQPIVVSSANSLTQLESARQQMAAQFGRQYPGIKSLDQQIASTRASLRAATGAALGNIKADLLATRAEVKQLTDYLNKLREQAAHESGPQAQFRSLSQEAASARTVYETFLEHSKEVVDRAALLEPPVAFVSHSAVPSSPTFPNRKKLLAGLAIVAVILGFGVILLLDYLSVAFGDVDDLRGAVQLPLLTTIPMVQNSGRTIARHVIDDPFSRASEAVRSLAGQLSLARGAEDRPHSVLVTSASAEEGKTTLAVWLGLTARFGGQRVLIVDGDHRRGTLTRHIPGSGGPGMTDLLSGQATLREVIQTDPDTRVDFIAAGTATTKPYGTGDIARLRALIGTLKGSYDLIIIDSPPLLAMTDGYVYASIADQTIFICRWESSSRRAVTSCLERLRAYGASIPGIVISMVDHRSTLALGDDYSRREMKLINKLYNS
ncbi:MAG TPA: Wzz/FepE/Etk N-terminal domain-containing protein [Acidisoma sp.]|uniref:GumC family protein n=1 Tax=Acidisoma sp. TaxID=1872115 RepID=UPI002BA25E38|nr:Wzz/FepE/Etk N-terminal domain-containing protein [Acidisoma sp.]HTI02384.1 Wzz/FepE/Etk N-terminal domain-containing protein [Acidisoma sp.]